MTIGELEQLAGVTDRTAFWMSFALNQSIPREHIFAVAVAELQRLAIERGTIPPPASTTRRRKDAKP